MAMSNRIEGIGGGTRGVGGGISARVNSGAVAKVVGPGANKAARINAIEKAGEALKSTPAQRQAIAARRPADMINKNSVKITNKQPRIGGHAN